MTLYEIVIFQNGYWTNDWDGVLHQTLGDAEQERSAAQACGYDALIATVTIVEPVA